jgi:hypothetical protein
MFIDDNQKRAEQTNQKQRRRQRGRQGRNEKKETGARAGDEQELDEVARAIALTSFISFLIRLWQCLCSDNNNIT